MAYSFRTQGTDKLFGEHLFKYFFTILGINPEISEHSVELMALSTALVG